MAAAEEKRLYKIGEVCKMADVQPYVLRYWETEFAALAPNKSGGGQRMYTQHEIDTILRIKQLLYTEGFTIAGAKKKLDSDGVELAPPAPAAAPVRPVGKQPASVIAKETSREMSSALRNVRDELSSILALLDD